MSSFWQSLKSALKDGVQTVSDKTEELAKIGRIKIEIIAVKRDIEKSFTEIGGRVYDILKEKKKITIPKDKDIRNLVEQIEKYEEKLHTLEADIDRIQGMKKEN